MKKFQSALQMSLDTDSMTFGESQNLVVAHVAVVVPEIVLKVVKVEKLQAHAFNLLVSAHSQVLSFQSDNLSLVGVSILLSLFL